MSVLRQIWVVKGVLEHSINQTLLQEIAAKHERIGTMPSGYFYPELYRNKETRNDWLIDTKVAFCVRRNMNMKVDYNFYLAQI